MRVSAAVWGVFPAVQAMDFPGPVPTQHLVQKIGAGWNPKPTQAPSLELFRNRRDIGIDPNTCGWVDGRSGGAIECRAGYTCMLYTPDNTIGMAGCCSGGDEQNCGWNTGCIDQAYYSTSCNDPSCYLNPFIIKCQESSAPFCMSWTYPSDQIQDHGCGTDSDSTWQTIEKAISTDGITTSLDLTYVPEDSVTGWRVEDQSTLFPDVDFSSSVASSRRSTRSSSLYVPLVTGGTSNSDFDYTTRRHRALSIGAIVGIVIGGISAIAVIIGAILFVFWDRRRKARNAAAAQINPTQNVFSNEPGPGPYTMPPGPPPAMQQYGQSPPQEYYGQDSKFNSQGSPQPQYAQPYSPRTVSPHQHAAVSVPVHYYGGSTGTPDNASSSLRPGTMLSSDGNSPVSAMAPSSVNGPPGGPSPQQQRHAYQPPAQNPVHEMG